MYILHTEWNLKQVRIPVRRLSTAAFSRLLELSKASNRPLNSATSRKSTSSRVKISRTEPCSYTERVKSYTYTRRPKCRRVYLVECQSKWPEIWEWECRPKWEAIPLSKEY